MPLAPRPTRNCPVCNQKLWEEEQVSRRVAWRYYYPHLHSTHPEFERWYRRVVLTYLVAIFTLLSGSAAGLVLGVPGLIVAPFVAAGFLSFVGVLVAIQMGKSRFRRQWSLDHGSAQASLS